MTRYISNEQKILNLKGAIIDEWLIIEMALFEYGEFDYPQFEYSDCPFIQAYVIQMKLSNGWFVKSEISVDQVQEPTLEYEPYIDKKSIFRFSKVPDFPIGLLSEVSLMLDDESNVTEVLLKINNQQILLMAGEVYEAENNTFYIHDCEDSVLVFQRPEMLQKVRFGPTLTR